MSAQVLGYFLSFFESQEVLAVELTGLLRGDSARRRKFVVTEVHCGVTAPIRPPILLPLSTAEPILTTPAFRIVAPGRVGVCLGLSRTRGGVAVGTGRTLARCVSLLASLPILRFPAAIRFALLVDPSRGVGSFAVILGALGLGGIGLTVFAGFPLFTGLLATLRGAFVWAPCLPFLQTPV